MSAIDNYFFKSNVFSSYCMSDKNVPVAIIALFIYT
jgi:hypothetical protein